MTVAVFFITWYVLGFIIAANFAWKKLVEEFGEGTQTIAYDALVGLLWPIIAAVVGLIEIMRWITWPARTAQRRKNQSTHTAPKK